MYVNTRGLITTDILLALFLNATIDVPAIIEVPLLHEEDSVPVVLAQIEAINYYPASSVVRLAGADIMIARLREDIDDIQAEVAPGEKYESITVCGVTRTLNITLLSDKFDATEYDALYGAGRAQNAISTILTQKEQTSFIGAHFAITQSPANISSSSSSSSPHNRYHALSDSEGLNTPRSRTKSISSVGSALTSRFNSLRASPNSVGSPQSSMYASLSASAPTSRMPSSMGVQDEQDAISHKRRALLPLPRMGFFAKKSANKPA